MRSPYADPSPPWQRALRSVALPASVAAHVALGLWVFKARVIDKTEPVWVEMAMVEVEPPPPPEPPPPEPQAPEPEKPKPAVKKEPVRFEETVDTPAEPTPTPPPERRPVRRVQGLSATSFAEGSGTGLNVRAGTTTGVAASDETMGLDEAQAFSILPYASVTTKPKARFIPPVEVPPEVIEADLEGSWVVLVDVDEEGRVTSATMRAPAGYGIDAACVAAFSRSRWKPGEQDGVPVKVTGIPMDCTIVKAPF